MNSFKDSLEKNSILSMNRIKDIIVVSMIVSIFILPFLSMFSYSIDDYHLLNLYNLNYDSMNYNFYSTGRFIEGIIAEILSILNLSPINKPFGQILFVISLVSLGFQFTNWLNIKKNEKLFVLLFAINPFWGELLYYSTNMIFCACSVIFLCSGCVFLFDNKKRLRIRVVGAIVCFYCSLATYQIFYPIIFYVLIYDILKKSIEGKSFIGAIKDDAVEIAIYMLSFLLYYSILQIVFFIKPPFLQYGFQTVFSKERLIYLYEVYKAVLFADNDMTSGKYFIFFMFINTAMILILGVRHRKLRGIDICTIIVAIVVGIVALAGFGILSADMISYRTFTSYSVFLMLLAISVQEMTSDEKVKKIMLAFTTVMILTNGIRMGRVAVDTIRLNTIENNLANRIIMRLEQMDNFDPNAHLIIEGSPIISQGDAIIGDLGSYNSPALSSFSKVLVMNEISGYNFQIPTAEDYEMVNEVLPEMDCWPNEGAVKNVDGIYIVRLN